MTKQILILLVIFAGVLDGQGGDPPEDMMITSLRKNTQVQAEKNGVLHENASPEKVCEFKPSGLVRYSDFGARGDGITDDINAIAAAHAFANQHGLPVRADDGATYYISGKERTVVIQTNTDFGTAAFIIDDTEVNNHRASIFLVSSRLQPFQPDGITSLKKNQEKVRISSPGTALEPSAQKGKASHSKGQEKVHISLPVSAQQPSAQEGEASHSEGQQQMRASGTEQSTSFSRGKQQMQATLPGSFLVTVTNSNVKRYIRYGPNQNSGSSQTDIFVVDREGNVDMDAPIIWDFDQVTDVTALPLDEDTLYITGGRFTTIANQAESKYNYYNRNIAIRRSNVVVDGMEHHVTGEGDHGAPYGGFIDISDCAYVTVQNTLLTGHKTYETIGSAGRPVSMGSYDLLVNRALNVSFINCSQTNDIDDRTYWGILGSNYSKNLLYDNCTLSRFDAHMGVVNATIRNSTLGHMGINAIGTGTFTVENSTIRGRNLINLRSDYGSTWQGVFIIRNCVFVPSGGRPVSASLINGSNSGQHDFGYTCYMPERIIIENLHIDDSSHPENYRGPAIFSDFNPNMTDATYQEKFPYLITREVVLRNVTTASGKELRLSDNPFMFRNVEVVRQ